MTKIEKKDKILIKVLSWWFGSSDKEKIGFLELQKQNLKVTKALNNLCQLLGIQGIEKIEYDFASPITEVAVLKLTTSHSLYSLYFKSCWHEDFPTVIVTNEHLKATYSYVKNTQSNSIRLEQNSLKYQTKRSQLSLLNEDNIVTKDRTTKLKVELTNGLIEVELKCSIDSLNFSITRIEEFLKSLETYNQVQIAYNKIILLLSNPLEQYKSVKIDANINGEQLYTIWENGIIKYNVHYQEEKFRELTSLKREKDQS